MDDLGDDLHEDVVAELEGVLPEGDALDVAGERVRGGELCVLEDGEVGFLERRCLLDLDDSPVDDNGGLAILGHCRTETALLVESLAEEGVVVLFEELLHVVRDLRVLNCGYDTFDAVSRRCPNRVDHLFQPVLGVAHVGERVERLPEGWDLLRCTSTGEYREAGLAAEAFCEGGQELPPHRVLRAEVGAGDDGELLDLLGVGGVEVPRGLCGEPGERDELLFSHRPWGRRTC